MTTAEMLSIPGILNLIPILNVLTKVLNALQNRKEIFCCVLTFAKSCL